MKWHIFLACLLLSPVGFVQGQEKANAGAVGAKEEPLELAGGKAIVMKPAPWKTMPPKSTMVQHEFRFPAEGEKSARITIMSAGGSVKDNVARWVGQFDGAKPEDAKVDVKEIGPNKIHIVEIAGTFKESAGGPMAPGPVKKLESYKMLGAILEIKDGGTVFIKATGPAEIVSDMKDAFVKMLEGMKSK